MKVLDKGHAKLFEHMGSDLSVVRNARVSYDAEWRTGEDAGKDEKLINYLMANNHTSPFEAVTFTFDIKCPIFVARQWHRHRTWSYNEISARYAELPEEFYVPDLESIGTQSQSHKQTRDIKENPFQDAAVELIRDQSSRAFNVYKILLQNQIPREIARSVLPLSTYTHFFGTVDLHNLFHFLKLRLHLHAQWEIQQYAKVILELIRPIVPVCVSVFERHQLGVEK